MRPDGGLAFAACARWEELRPGRYGVCAPPPEAPDRPLGEGDLLLVPAVAFDRRGGRLGRGKGCYDRALAGAEAALAVAVGYEFQLVETVPMEAHDRRVDALLTDRRWRRVAAEETEAGGSP